MIYGKDKISPLEFIIANNLDFITGRIIELLCESTSGNQYILNLKEVKNLIDKIIEKEKS